MDCSLPERLLPLIVISMAGKQVLAPPNILVIQVPPSIEISMGRLLARARLRVGCQTKVPIIIMDGAVQSQKVNNPKKLLYMVQLIQLLSFMSLQFLHPFCQLGRRALDYYRFIYMYHKPID